jgi:hypothetical protein
MLCNKYRMSFFAAGTAGWEIAGIRRLLWLVFTFIAENHAMLDHEVPRFLRENALFPKNCLAGKIRGRLQ